MSGVAKGSAPVVPERADAVHYHTQHDPHRQASGLGTLSLADRMDWSMF